MALQNTPAGDKTLNDVIVVVIIITHTYTGLCHYSYIRVTGCHHLCVPLPSCLSSGAGLQLRWVTLLLQWAGLRVCVVSLRGGAEYDGQVEFRTVSQRGGGEGEGGGVGRGRWRDEGDGTPHPETIEINDF